MGKVGGGGEQEQQKWLEGKKVFKTKDLMSKSTGQNLMRNDKASRSNLMLCEGRKKGILSLNPEVDSMTIPIVKSLTQNSEV